MERGRFLSLKRKIDQANASLLAQVAEELLCEGEAVPSDLVVALTLRLSSGAYLNSWTLGKLVVLSRNRDLYEVPHTKNILLGSIDVLVDFLRAGIPDREIEVRICERLMRDFEENSYGRRDFCLIGLRDYGSINCLDTLEAIDFDFHGRFQTAKTVAEALDQNSRRDESEITFMEWSDAVIRNTDLMLGARIKEAIEAVRSRNLQPKYEWSDQVSPESVQIPLETDFFEQANGYLELARIQLDTDLGSSLNNIRKATESLLKTVIKIQKIQPKSVDTIDQMLLPSLIGTVMSNSGVKLIPKHIHQYLSFIQSMSTMGSHDQGLPSDSLFERGSVEGLLSTFNIVRKFFQTYLQN